MASSNRYAIRRSPPSLTGEQPIPVGQTRFSYTTFLCKSLFALFLVALPLFPSQAPDFVGETVLTKFWELLHLLFVGIAVSYGLFSRRNVDLEVDLQSNTFDDPQSYMSRMLLITSLFDYGSENSCAFDEKNVSRTLSSRYLASESKIEATDRISVLDGEQKSGSFTVESELGDSFEYNKINEVQAWNSQYFQGGSTVVVAQPAYGLDDYVSHKPLRLPVRSLRSNLRETQTPEYSHESESDSNFSAFSQSSEGNANGEFDYLSSMKLEETFDEAKVSSSPIPWRSRFERMGMRENVRGGTHHSHFRPLSVNESQSESLKSRSFQSTASSSSQTSLTSHTQRRFSPSLSLSSESSNSNEEELGKEKSYKRSSQTSSPSPSPSHSRHYSHGSLLEDDVRRSFENQMEEGISIGRRNDFLSRKDGGSVSLKLNAEELRKGNSSRRSYPPDSVSPAVDGEDSPTKWHSQQYNHGKFFKEDVRRKSEDDLKNLSGNRINGSLGRRSRDRSSSKSRAEEYEKNESFRGSYPQNSLSPTRNYKASKHALHSRHWSHGSLLEKDVTRNLEDDSVDSNRRGRKEFKSGSLRWESESGKADKVPSRGKSVRTFRAGRYNKEVSEVGDLVDNQSDGKLKRTSAEAEAEYMEKTEFRSRGQENMSNGRDDRSLGHSYPKPKPKYFEEKSGRGKQFAGGYMADDGDDSEESEAEQPLVRIGEEAPHDGASEAEHDPDEVDRKAGEFIAKFREQIRLQKAASGELPRGRHR